MKIILLRNSGLGIDFKTIWRAHECLHVITNINADVTEGDSPYFYLHDSILIKDIKKWDNWYSKNHSRWNMTKADKLFQKINKEEHKRRESYSAYYKIRDSIIPDLKLDMGVLKWPTNKLWIQTRNHTKTEG